MKKLIGGRIRFGSGHTVDISLKEFEDAPIMMANKGARVQRFQDGVMVPFLSPTIECIEPRYAEVEVEVEESPVVVKKIAQPRPIELNMPKMDEAPEPPKKKTQQELLEEMTAKSNCKHEPNKLELYRQHTAKGIRYFPRCSFCGKRERYVSESKIVKGEYAGTVNEKWTEQDIMDAIDWIDK
jgi:outer membrane biosynthesis protein TonB